MTCNDSTVIFIALNEPDDSMDVIVNVPVLISPDVI